MATFYEKIGAKIFNREHANWKIRKGKLIVEEIIERYCTKLCPLITSRKSIYRWNLRVSKYPNLVNPRKKVVLCLSSSFERDAVVLSHKTTSLGRLNGE